MTCPRQVRGQMTRWEEVCPGGTTRHCSGPSTRCRGTATCPWTRTHGTIRPSSPRSLSPRIWSGLASSSASSPTWASRSAIIFLFSSVNTSGILKRLNPRLFMADSRLILKSRKSAVQKKNLYLHNYERYFVASLEN